MSATHTIFEGSLALYFSHIYYIHIILLFICLYWVFIVVRAFLQLWLVGIAVYLHCSGFSLQWLLLNCRAQALKLSGFNNCGSQALEHRLSIVAHGLNCSAAWTRSGIKPMSLVLADGFFTTEPATREAWVSGNFEIILLN